MGDWWSLLIVRDALAGVRRFSDFQRNLGVAKNILTQRLRRMVELGIMVSVPGADGGAYRDYELTEKGKGLLIVILALRQWGLDSCFASGEAYTALVDSKTELPLARLEARSQNGEVLTLQDLRMKQANFGDKADG